MYSKTKRLKDGFYIINSSNDGNKTLKEPEIESICIKDRLGFEYKYLYTQANMNSYSNRSYFCDRWLPTEIQINLNIKK